MFAVMEKIRLVIKTEDEVRAALKVAAAKRGMDMADLATEILREALADELAEVRRTQGKKKKPGEK